MVLLLAFREQESLAVTRVYTPNQKHVGSLTFLRICFLRFMIYLEHTYTYLTITAQTEAFYSSYLRSYSHLPPTLLTMSSVSTHE